MCANHTFTERLQDALCRVRPSRRLPRVTRTVDSRPVVARGSELTTDPMAEMRAKAERDLLIDFYTASKHATALGVTRAELLEQDAMTMHRILRGCSRPADDRHSSAAERRHESKERASRRSFASHDMHIVFARLVSPLPGLESLVARSRNRRRARGLIRRGVAGRPFHVRNYRMNLNWRCQKESSALKTALTENRRTWSPTVVHASPKDWTTHQAAGRRYSNKEAAKPSRLQTKGVPRRPRGV